MPASHPAIPAQAGIQSKLMIPYKEALFDWIPGQARNDEVGVHFVESSHHSCASRGCAVYGPEDGKSG